MSTRPTLPPLHTLRLPRHHNLLTQPPFCLSSSRTPSPHSPLVFPRPHVPPHAHRPPHPAPTFRLVPTPLEDATALLILPPPTHGIYTSHEKPLLLLGPAVELLNGRGPGRRIASLKGVRIHPYRIMRGGKGKPA